MVDGEAVVNTAGTEELSMVTGLASDELEAYPGMASVELDDKAEEVTGDTSEELDTASELGDEVAAKEVLGDAVGTTVDGQAVMIAGFCGT
jgi:hypothetical protein